MLRNHLELLDSDSAMQREDHSTVEAGCCSPRVNNETEDTGCFSGFFESGAEPENATVDAPAVAEPSAEPKVAAPAPAVETKADGEFEEQQFDDDTALPQSFDQPPAPTGMMPPWKPTAPAPAPPGLVDV